MFNNVQHFLIHILPIKPKESFQSGHTFWLECVVQVSEGPKTLDPSVLPDAQGISAWGLWGPNGCRLYFILFH